MVCAYYLFVLTAVVVQYHEGGAENEDAAARAASAAGRKRARKSKGVSASSASASSSGGGTSTSSRRGGRREREKEATEEDAQSTGEPESNKKHSKARSTRRKEKVRRADASGCCFNGVREKINLRRYAFFWFYWSGRRKGSFAVLCYKRVGDQEMALSSRNKVDVSGNEVRSASECFGNTLRVLWYPVRIREYCMVRRTNPSGVTAPEGSYFIGRITRATQPIRGGGTTTRVCTKFRQIGHMHVGAERSTEYH